DGTVQAAATPAHVAFGGSRHPPDANHRRTVHRMRANPTRARRPRVRIDAEMQRRYPGEDREHAVYRAKMTAPDALAFSIDETDRDRGERRPAKHEERRRCVLVHAHDLAEDRGQRERDERPPAPTQPPRHTEPKSVAA